MKKSGLGRGLDALLPESVLSSESGIRNISTTLVDVNKNQPRKNFDEEKLQSLAENIKTVGLLQPILVIEKNGRYQIVAGERRFRAALLAGLKTVSCVVRDLSPAEQMEIALIENLQREDLNPIEEAQGIDALLRKYRYTHETAAQRLGLSRSALTNTLRLLTLTDSVQKEIENGNLSAGHGRALAALPAAEAQRLLADQVISEKLNVRETEALVQRYLEKKPVSVRQPSSLPLSLKDMENRMREAVGVKVEVTGSEKRGKIVLRYYSENELDSLFTALEKLEK